MDLSTALPTGVSMVLTAMAYLLVKHAVADFLLQTEYQRRSKGDYGALGGISHALTHIVLTAPVFWLLPNLTFGIAAALLATEFVVHYHLDWTKDRVVRANGWTSHDTPFWWAIGLDQMMHGLTYVAILWLGLTAAAGPLPSG